MASSDLLIQLGNVVLFAGVLKVLHIGYVAYKFFLRPGKDLRKYGQWAVVTGATDGIGRAYAFELASKGLSVFLIARNEEKLVETQKALESKFPPSSASVSFAHLKVDFANFDATARAAVKVALAPLDIGVLINNVGLSYPFTKYFHELKDSDVAEIMEVNISSCTWMTRIVLGDVEDLTRPVSGMLQRGRGAIVNTSSGAGRAASPLLCEYSAAKAYVELFSQGLAAELAPKGIHVQVQTPLYVTTKMAKIRKASFTVPSPEDYVKLAVKQIGYDSVISPHWTHSLQLYFLSLLPEFLALKLVGDMHHSIRKKGLQKEREAKGN